MTRIGGAFIHRVAVFVYPFPMSSLASDAEERLRARATSAVVSLRRAAWKAYVLHSDGRLAEAWQKTGNKQARAVASSS